MDKVHPLSSPMIVRSLDVKNDPFCPCEKDEECWKNKILSRPTGRAFFEWSFSTLINIH